MLPDSFVQMSILLAYYKLYGKVVCIYKPVLTKAFYHGRTEAVRSAMPLAKMMVPTQVGKLQLDIIRLECLQQCQHVVVVNSGKNVSSKAKELCIKPNTFQGIVYRCICNC